MPGEVHAADIPDLVVKLRKYKSINTLSMSQIVRIFSAEQLAALGFGIGLKKIKTYARSLLDGASAAEAVAAEAQPSEAVAQPVLAEVAPAIDGDEGTEVRQGTGGPASTATKKALHMPGRYGGTLPQCPGTTAALKLWLSDMGDTLQGRPLQDGMPDRSSSEFSATLKRLVRSTFKVNSPGVIAAYYRRAGHPPPEGLENLTEVTLTPEAREWGNAAFAHVNRKGFMMGVYREMKGELYSVRRLVAAQRMRDRFND